jgi:hypothetical protein
MVAERATVSDVHDPATLGRATCFEVCGERDQALLGLGARLR